MLRFLIFALSLARCLSLVTSTSATAAEKTFCSNTAPNVVVFLDVTTPYDEGDKATLVEGVSRIFEALEGGTRLSMRTIEDESTSSHRLVDICIPFCPSEGFWIDLLSDCTDGVIIDTKKQQRLMISEALVQTTKNRPELSHSAIVRTIALHAPEEFAEGRENRIYMFSDMIENSDYLSGKDFSRKPNDALIARLEQDQLIPNLNGAAVKVFGVGRGGSAARAPLTQERLTKLQDFWTRFFKTAGASVTLQQNLGVSD